MSEQSAVLPHEAEDNSVGAIIREAIFGSKRDFTKGSLLAALIILSIPMVAEMAMEGIFAIVDIFFVAKLGADAVTVVGLTESMLALVYAVGIGLSIAATATVARRTGENDPEGASKAAAHIIYLGIIVSVIISIIGIVFARDLLEVLGATPEVADLGTPFMQIMLGGNGVIIFLFLLNAIFRGAGDASIAMRVLIISNLTNIILDPCFIFGLGPFPEMGVTGAAIATTIGRGIGVVYASWCLFFRSNGRISVNREHLTFDPTVVKKLIRLSSTAVLQLIIATASWSVLVRIVAAFGSVAVAGYVIGLRVIVFVLMLCAGVANAAAALVGQNLGAEKPERAERAVWIASGVNMVFLGVIGVFFLLFSRELVSFFTTEPDVLSYGEDCLRVLSYGLIFYAVAMVLESAFNGAGDTLTPTYINLFIFWIVEIPLAFILSNGFGWVKGVNDLLPTRLAMLDDLSRVEYNLGPYGVFWAITISFSLFTVVAAILFKLGKWKQKQV